MTHLYIELNTGLTEEVNSSIISKLYELAISGDLDETSDLKGRLHSTVARDTHISYLTTHYPLLYITADAQYFTFADPEVDRVLSQTWGDGTGVTLATLSTKTKISDNMFINNTAIETFDELGLFDNITILENQAFLNATSLRSIDLLNIISIKSLVFNNCQNLLIDEINLPNLELLNGNASFGSCKKIKHIVSLGKITEIPVSYEGCFRNCTGLLDATLPDTLTSINTSVFEGCTNLNWVKLLSETLPTYSHTDRWGRTNYYCFGEKWTNEVYSGQTYPIYVKDELLSQYQAADGWKDVGPNRLRPLSQFAIDFPNE